ncbi:MAG TPA: DNA translocase FtsK [Candidatus Sumerlaeota bacterium]|nr:DNA translocase FtsK [Candidatus Sumerlaeota bacterium]
MGKNPNPVKPLVRAPRLFWGLPVEKWREIIAFVLVGLAVLLMLALLSDTLNQGWMGILGDAMAGMATFLLGKGWVSFVFPGLLFLAAIHAFHGRTPFHPTRKAFAGALILMALCALRSLPFALSDAPEAYDLAFIKGGVIGGYLTSGKSYALNLPGLCGSIGAYLVATLFLVLGVMLSTDFLFVPLLHGTFQKIRARMSQRKQPPPVATLQLERAKTKGFFPSILTGRKSKSTERPPLPLPYDDEEESALPAPFPSRKETSAASISASPSSSDDSKEQDTPSSAFSRRRPQRIIQLDITRPFETDQPDTSPLEQPERSLSASHSQEPVDPEAAPEQEESRPPLRIISHTRPTPPPPAEEEPAVSKAMVQTELDFSSGQYHLPSMDLFHTPQHADTQMDREEILEISGELERALADFNISARVVAVTQGPVVTQYELQPAPGVKVSRILSLENDIALILRAKSVRIQAPIPGKAAIGIEVPNRKITPVFFRDLISSEKFLNHKAPLAFPLGKNISGETLLCDLATMPHLLIAGTTGSGKSVCVNVIISSILFRMPPDRVKFIMIDPKRVELNVYSDIPHLLAPVVNDPRQAAAALLWAVQQMEERLTIFSQLRVRNIDGYNALASGERQSTSGIATDDLKLMPHIVIIIDELADLMIIAKNEVEEFIVRLAQMSRAAGIHLIIATQRPSVNVLTGIIKANFPSRIAFRVSAKVDSRTILDTNGAETLLGRGDMLYSAAGTKPMRVQGAFLSDEEVEGLTDFLRKQNPANYEKTDFSLPELAGSDGEMDENNPYGEFSDVPGFEAPPTPKPSLVIAPESTPFERRNPSQVEFPALQLKGEQDEDEVLYDKALRLVLETKKPSVSMIQRRLKIGFARAGRLMDIMEERGIVGPYLGSKPRDLILDDPEGLLRRMDEDNIGR